MVPSSWNSFRPLKEVHISKRCTDNPNYPTIWVAFAFALFDGVRRLDTRLDVMFDLTEQRLRDKCKKHGYTITN